MITKTKFWKNIVKQLKEAERSKQFTTEIMERIKGIPQNEDK
tara:strand:+ start:135 stop:260 length:126 start_codon:yes stop_codon:yes gene_type:complete